MMEITPDQIVYWTAGPFRLNATLVFTWLVMALLVLVSWLATRSLGTPGDAPDADVVRLSPWQNALEAVVETIQEQIRQATAEEGEAYLPFVGTLFLFVAGCNVLGVVPGFHPPTASLATAAALAGCVFVAVPLFGISRLGFRAYLRRYLRPTPFMLPFHVIGELSRTLSLAIRLFGNIASGTLVVSILLSLTPFFVPVAMRLFGLLIGLIQAYVFAVLALVYIASAARAQSDTRGPAT